jgi:hypothetical protein
MMNGAQDDADVANGKLFPSILSADPLMSSQSGLTSPVVEPAAAAVVVAGAMVQQSVVGHFKLMDEVHHGRPCYKSEPYKHSGIGSSSVKSVETKRGVNYLYYLSNGTWNIGNTLGSNNNR